MPELPINFHKSTFSGASGCVEVGFHAGSVLVRDTKDRHGSTLTFTPLEWRAFVDGVVAGEFTMETLADRARISTAPGSEAH